MINCLIALRLRSCPTPRGDAIATSQIGDSCSTSADAGYAAALREALTNTGPWDVEMVDRSDPRIPCVLVLDESSLEQLSLPLANPERVVLISQQDPPIVSSSLGCQYHLGSFQGRLPAHGAPGHHGRRVAS